MRGLLLALVLLVAPAGATATGGEPAAAVLLAAGDIADCRSDGDERTAAPPRRPARHGRRPRRLGLRARHGRRVRALLRADLGQAPGAHAARGRQPRVRDPRRGRLLPLLRPARAPAARLLRLLARRLAHPRPEHELRPGGRLRRRLAAGALAARRARRAAAAAASSPTGTTRASAPASTGPTRASTRSGAPSRRAAPSSTSPATTTTTSASRRCAACASSSSAPAGGGSTRSCARCPRASGGARRRTACSGWSCAAGSYAWRFVLRERLILGRGHGLVPAGVTSARAGGVGRS